METHMKLRVQKQTSDGSVRLETSGTIKEIMINEDFLHPNSESISICFRGTHSSGIVDMTPKELENIYNIIKTKIHLIKGMKRLD
jgi:hypothetical protein